MQDLSETFKALGDPIRLQIIELLPTRPVCGRKLNVSALADKLEVSQPTVSHHLKILKHAGIVRCEKMCRDVYYFVNQEAIESCTQSLLSSALPD